MFTLSLRRKVSYVLLPAMIVYTFLPCMPSYASASVSSSSSSGAGNNSIEGHAISASKVKESNDLNKKKLKGIGLQCENADAGTSMAGNYTMGINAQVNARTGRLDFGYSIAKREGLSKETGVDVKLSYIGGEQKYFNIPFSGWRFNLDYIEDGRIYLNGSQNFLIDPQFTSYDQSGRDYNSGLFGYSGFDLKLFKAGSSNLSDEFKKYLRNDVVGSDGAPLGYVLLSRTTGAVEYFDIYGKLLRVEDACGNAVTYEYRLKSGSIESKISDVYLSKITDSIGKEIIFTYGENSVTARLPDGRESTIRFIYGTSNAGMIELTDVTGHTSIIELEGSDSHISSIRYPGGALVMYKYENNIPCLLKSGGTIDFPSVTRVEEYPGANSKAIVTEYRYTVDNNHNFTGYPDVPFDNSRDALMNSDKVNYTYKTEITNLRSDDCGGDVKTTQCYNYLHLLKSSTVEVDGKTVNEVSVIYCGEDVNGNFQNERSADGSIIPKANYNLPKQTITKYGSREVKINTWYDDYGKKVKEERYNNARPVSLEEITYFPGKPGFIESRSYTDYLADAGSRVSTIKNQLSADGKYIKSSTVTSSGISRLTTNENIDLKANGALLKGLPAVTRLSDGKESSNVELSYGLSGDILTITKKSEKSAGAWINESMSIDVNSGYVVSEVDGNGNVTSYDHSLDRNGNILKVTYPDGSYKITDTRDLNLTKEVYSNGLKTEKVMDGFGHVTKASVMFSDGSSLPSVSAVYNDLGKVSSSRDIYGNVTTYSYDYLGRVVSSKDYLGNVDTYVYEDDSETPQDALSATHKQTRYINGVKASISWLDDKDNVVKSNDLLTKQTSTLTANYNGKSQKTSSTLNRGATIAKMDNVKYDDDGDILSADVTIGQIKAKASVSRTLLGNVTSQELDFSDIPASENIDQSADKKVKSETRMYDKLGRLIELKDQAGNLIKYEYDDNSNLSKITDFAKREFRYEYDNMNRMTAMRGTDMVLRNFYYAKTDPDKGEFEGQLESRVLVKNGAKEDKITYKYAPSGLLSSVEYEDGRSLSATYDKYQKIHILTDFAGVETTFDYGTPGNNGIIVPDNVKSISNQFGRVEYAYYTKADHSLFGACSTVSRVSRIGKNDSSAVTSTSYDYYKSDAKLPMLRSVVVRRGSGDNAPLISSSSYTYDEKDRVESILQLSGSEKASDVNCNNLKKFSYNKFDRLIKEDVFSVKKAEGSEDDAIVENKSLGSTSFHYDERGNITQRTITDAQGNSHRNKYAYNDINQLKSITKYQNGVEVSNSAEAFDYDKNGNMTKAYRGDLQKDGSRPLSEEFTYNELNQLISYHKVNNTSVYNYSYNAEGLRKVKYIANMPGKWIKYYYLPTGDVINELDYTGSISAYLIAGERVLRAVRTTSGGEYKVDWYVKNHKDVVGMADSSGRLSCEYQYTPYGEKRDLSKSPGAEHSATAVNVELSIKDNPYQYSEYYLDSESGNYYCQARYYSPRLMRFISWDTYDVSNRYAYCNGSPIANIDPNGHNALSCFLTVFSLVVTVVAAIATAGAAGAALAAGTATAFTFLGIGMAAVAIGDSAYSTVQEFSKTKEENSGSDWSWKKEDTTQNVASIVAIAFSIGSIASDFMSIAKSIKTIRGRALSSPDGNAAGGSKYKVQNADGTQTERQVQNFHRKRGSAVVERGGQEASVSFRDAKKRFNKLISDSFLDSVVDKHGTNELKNNADTFGLDRSTWKVHSVKGDTAMFTNDLLGVNIGFDINTGNLTTIGRQNTQLSQFLSQDVLDARNMIIEDIMKGL